MSSCLVNTTKRGEVLDQRKTAGGNAVPTLCILPRGLHLSQYRGWGSIFSTPAPDILSGEFINANANDIFDHFWFRNGELVERSTTKRIYIRKRFDKVYPLLGNEWRLSSDDEEQECLLQIPSKRLGLISARQSPFLSESHFS